MFNKPLFFSCFAMIAGVAQGPAYLDYWQKIIKGSEIEETSEGQSWEFANQVKTFNEFEGKQILSFIREADYAHAGESEALDLMMSYFEKDPYRTVLDVACGLGGSVDYFQKNGLGKVTGCDIEKESIQYAQMHYPENEFFIADACHLSDFLQERFFDLIYIVNSFVCFPDQLACLKELKKVCKPSTRLIIFDYTDPSGKYQNPLTGQSKQVTFLPIKREHFNAMADSAGWEITHYVSLDQEFIQWYKAFLELTEEKRKDIDNKFGRNATNFVRGKYDLIHHGLTHQWLGGCILILSPKQ